MKKIIFLDVDGTLINYSAKLPESARTAVNLARENGHKVFICTGCSKFEILERDLPEIDGMILANGGYVEADNNIILHTPICYDKEKAIVDWCTNRHLGLVLEANSGKYINEYFLDQGLTALTKYVTGKGDNNIVAEKQAKQFMKNYTLSKNDKLYREDINKISFVLSSYKDHLDSKKDFPDLIANTWGGKNEMALFGDLAPNGITKKTAIEALLKYLDADVNDTIAFGDAHIDLSMFEICHYNVAMGNGSDEIKEAANYITDDVDNDGLYNAFKYLNLI